MKTVFLLLLLNLLIFGLIVGLEIRKPKTESCVRYPGALELNSLEIDGMRLLGPQKEVRWAVQRGHRGWMLTQPYLWPAQVLTVESLLKELQFLESLWVKRLEDLTAKGETLESYGLGEQDPCLELELRRGQSLQTFRIAVKNNRLTLLDTAQHRLFEVQQSALATLFEAPKHFGQATFFSPKPFEVERMDWEGQGQNPLRLVHAPTGWRIESPIETQANAGAVRTALSQLTSIPVFLPTFAAPEFKKPLGSVTLFFAHEPETLLIYGPVEPSSDTPMYWVKREGLGPPYFWIPQASVSALTHPLETLRERSLFTVVPEELKELVITYDSVDIRIAKDADGSWSVYDADGTALFRADPDILRALFKTLEQLRVKDFFEDAPTLSTLRPLGLAPPERRVCLTHKARSEVLFLGKIDPNNKIVYAKKEGFVYTLPMRLLGQLPSDPLAYRSRQIQHWDPKSQVLSLTLTDLETQETRSELPEPLIAAILNFRAQSYLPNTPQIPWKYRIEAHIRTPDGHEHTLNFQATQRIDATTQYATTEELTFVLEQEWIDFIKSQGELGSP